MISSNNHRRMSSSSNRRRSSSSRNAADVAAEARNKSDQRQTTTSTTRTTSLSDRLVLSLTRIGGSGGGGPRDHHDDSDNFNMNIDEEGSSSTIEGLRSEEFRFITAASAASRSATISDEEDDSDGERQQEVAVSRRKRRSFQQQQRRPSKQLVQQLPSYGEDEEGEDDEQEDDMDGSDFEDSEIDDDSRSRGATDEDFDADSMLQDSLDGIELYAAKLPLPPPPPLVQEQRRYFGQEDERNCLDKEEEAMVLAAVAAAEREEEQQQQQELEHLRRFQLHEEKQLRILQEQEEYLIQQEEQRQQQELYGEQQKRYQQQQNNVEVQSSSTPPPDNMSPSESPTTEMFATRIGFDGKLVHSPRKRSSSSLLSRGSNNNGNSNSSNGSPGYYNQQPNQNFNNSNGYGNNSNNNNNNNHFQSPNGFNNNGYNNQVYAMNSLNLPFSPQQQLGHATPPTGISPVTSNNSTTSSGINQQQLSPDPVVAQQELELQMQLQQLEHLQAQLAQLQQLTASGQFVQQQQQHQTQVQSPQQQPHQSSQQPRLKLPERPFVPDDECDNSSNAAATGSYHRSRNGSSRIMMIPENGNSDNSTSTTTSMSHHDIHSGSNHTPTSTNYNSDNNNEDFGSHNNAAVPRDDAGDYGRDDDNDEDEDDDADERELQAQLQQLEMLQNHLQQLTNAGEQQLLQIQRNSARNLLLNGSSNNSSNNKLGDDGHDNGNYVEDDDDGEDEGDFRDNCYDDYDEDDGEDYDDDDDDDGIARPSLKDYRIPSKASLMDESQQDEEESIVQEYRYEQITRSPSFRARHRAASLAAAAIGAANTAGNTLGSGGLRNSEWDTNDSLYPNKNRHQSKNSGTILVSEELINEIAAEGSFSSGSSASSRSSSRSRSYSSRGSYSSKDVDEVELRHDSDDDDDDGDDSMAPAEPSAAASLSLLSNFLNRGDDENDNSNKYQRPSKSAMMDGQMDDDENGFERAAAAAAAAAISALETRRSRRLEQIAEVSNEGSRFDDFEVILNDDDDNLYGSGDLKPAARMHGATESDCHQRHNGSIATSAGGCTTYGTEAIASMTTAPTEQSSPGGNKGEVIARNEIAQMTVDPGRGTSPRAVSMSFLPGAKTSSSIDAASVSSTANRRQSQPSPKKSEPTSRISRKFAFPKLGRAVSESAMYAASAMTRTHSSSGIGGVFRGKDLRQRSTSARLNEPAVEPGAVAIRGVDKSENSDLYDDVHDISGTFSVTSSKELNTEHSAQRRSSRSATARRSIIRKFSGAYNILARDVSVVTAEMDVPDYEAVEQERLELQRRVEEMEAKIRNSVAAAAIPEPQVIGTVPIGTANAIQARTASSSTFGRLRADEAIVNGPVRSSSAMSSDVENQLEAGTDSLHVINAESHYTASVDTTGDGGDGGAEGSVTMSSDDSIGLKFSGGKRNCCIVGALLVIVLGVALAIGASRRTNNAAAVVPPPTNPDTGDASANTVTSVGPLKPTLERVLERGRLICRADHVDVQQGEGISIDLCRALAAAILGDPKKIELPTLSLPDHWSALESGLVDVSTSLTAYSMDRDVYEANSGGKGFTFSTPILYAGSTFVGDPDYVDCADRGDTLLGNCRGLSVCVIDGTATSRVIEEMLDGSNTLIVSTGEELLTNFVNGKCNVIAGPNLLVYQEALVRSAGYQGSIVLGPRVYDKLPMTIVSRGDDPEFGDLVNWIIRSLFVAESMGVTKDTAGLFPATSLWGDDNSNMFRNVIGTIGNYGEFYGRWLASRIPLNGLNMLNTLGNTGLIYSMPMGDTLLDTKLTIDKVPGPSVGGTLERIAERGHLNCGVVNNTSDASKEGRIQGFSRWNTTIVAWEGFDVDYCRGLSAALFAGDADRVQYQVFTTMSDGFAALHGTDNRDVDVLTGALYNMQNDIKEPTTGSGFSFSPVYYYHEQPNSLVSSYALASREDDEQWSDFITWLVYGTMYAEELGINAGGMPVIELFGERYKQSLRDAILAIGHYGQLYDRNMERYVPRSGRNLINTGADPQMNPSWKFE